MDVPYLVSTDWLSEHLDDDNLRLLDVSAMLTSKLINQAKEAHYDQGHIPGAVFFDVASGKGELSDPNGSLPWTWPEQAQFENTMGRFGIDNDTHVIIHARTPRPGLDSGTMWCTRAWWLMFHFGVKCSILQGGVEQWEKESKPLETGQPEITPVQFSAIDNSTMGRSSKQDVLNNINDDQACLIDTLPAASFDGTSQGYGPRKGHIKTAVNKPYSGFVSAETAGFLPRESLEKLMADVMEKPKVITYCGGAIAATVGAFVMHMLGHKNISVYDNSLMEWSADDSLPMVDSTGSTDNNK